MGFLINEGCFLAGLRTANPLFKEGHFVFNGGLDISRREPGDFKDGELNISRRDPAYLIVGPRSGNTHQEAWPPARAPHGRCSGTPRVGGGHGPCPSGTHGRPRAPLPHSTNDTTGNVVVRPSAGLARARHVVIRLPAGLARSKRVVTPARCPPAGLARSR